MNAIQLSITRAALQAAQTINRGAKLDKRHAEHAEWLFQQVERLAQEETPAGLAEIMPKLERIWKARSILERASKSGE